MRSSLKYSLVFLSMIFIMEPSLLMAQEEEPEKHGEVEDAEILITKDRQLS